MSLPLAGHFSHLVLPVVHRVSVEADERERRRGVGALGNRLDQRWSPWWSRLDDEAVVRALDDSWFLLPHVRRLLFADLPLVRGDEVSAEPPELTDPRSSLMKVKQLARRAPSDLYRETDNNRRPLFKDGVLRLTFKDLGDIAQLTVVVRGQRLSLHLEWIDLLVFPDGVSFLVLRVELDEDPMTLRALRDALFALRQVHKPSIHTSVATFRAGSSRDFELRDLVDFLVGDLTTGQTFATLDAFLQADPQCRQRYSETADGQSYSEVFRPWTWAMSEVPITDHAADSQAASNGRLDTPADRALHDLAMLVDSEDPLWAPCPEVVRHRWAEHRLALWRSWSAMILTDHCAFLGTEPTWFVEENVAHNVGFDYFQLYLLVLYQKVRLNTLAGELLQPRASANELSAARDVSTEFVEFRNRYWFAEVSGKSQGEVMHMALRQSLGVEALFTLVGEEVKDLRSHVEEVNTRRTNELVGGLTTVVAPATIWLAALGAVADEPPWTFVLWSTVAILLLGLGVWHEHFRSPNNGG